ncbi:hypothetical protein Egran_04899, partial [Elaphomyces granulatus]
MRFGRKLHQYQVPAWADFYIHYDRLKGLIKDGRMEELQKSVAHGAERVDAFVAKKTSAIRDCLTLLEIRYGLASGPLDTDELRQVALAELQDLQASLFDIATDLTRLEWYIRVNQEGLRRISTKLGREQGEVGAKPTIDTKTTLRNIETPCTELLRRVNWLLRSVHDAMADGSVAVRTVSLLKQLRDIEPSTVLEAAQWGVLKDDTTALSALDKDLLDETDCHSDECCAILLPQLRPIQETRFFSADDFLHRFIIQMGRRYTLDQRRETLVTMASEWSQVLNLLDPSQQPLFQNGDLRGRLPLHYATEYGLVDVCREILGYMDSTPPHNQPAWLVQDFSGETPLHLAVRVGNVALTQIFCQAILNQESINWESIEQIWGQLLALAVRSGFQDVLEALLLIERDINYQGEYGETAIFLAAQHGQAKMIRALVKMSAKINLSETTRAWTPLIVACVHGHQDAVDVLLQAGADIRTCDIRGWSAKDHAAFRGYPRIIEALQQQEKMTIKANIPESLPTVQNETLSSNVYAEMFPRVTQARQFDSMGSHIFVNLGSFDSNRQLTAVNMEPYRAKIAPAQLPETSLFLEISMINSQQEPSLVQLPILEDRSNEPWHFVTDDPSRAGLSFKVFSAVNGGEQPIGSAVALLDSLKQGSEAARESLVRDYTIPVISCTDGDFLGTLTFTFVIARPFKFAQKTPTPPQRLRSVESTKIVGHRGEGKITLDVQVTKDNVPIIYHDFLVSETGTDATMDTLTYGQVMILSNAQLGKIEETPSARRLPWDERDRPSFPRRRRAWSLCAPPDSASIALCDRMRHTSEYSTYGLKGNMRGDHIHEPFATLKEVLLQLPQTVSFDIELKYPMLFEAGDWKMDPHAMELNRFLDNILHVVYEFGGNRSLFFSSFSPELCMLLAMKQQIYPIVFLNDSSNAPTGDIRATSLQTAVHFARRFNLQGVVMASEPFIASPKLIRLVKDRGLFCASYGPLNDVPEHAKTQAEAGLDVLIVNKVHLIATVLGK